MGMHVLNIWLWTFTFWPTNRQASYILCHGHLSHRFWFLWYFCSWFYALIRCVGDDLSAWQHGRRLECKVMDDDRQTKLCSICMLCVWVGAATDNKYYCKLRKINRAFPWLCSSASAPFSLQSKWQYRHSRLKHLFLDSLQFTRDCLMRNWTPDYTCCNFLFAFFW